MKPLNRQEFEKTYYGSLTQLRRWLENQETIPEV